MGYSGWKLTGTITFVKNKQRNMSYIVDPDNKNQFENATKWVRKDSCEIFTTDNDGFTLKIITDAGGSSQGGKLSFWTVEVQKGEFVSYVGMDSAALCDLIKTTTFINGTCQSNLVVTFHNGKQIFVAKDSDNYKKAKADTETKAEAQKRKKTSNHTVGKVYSTLTTNSVYLFSCWQCYKIEITDQWSRHPEHRLRKIEPVRVYCFRDIRPGEKASAMLESDWAWLDATMKKLPSRYENDEFNFTYDINENDLIEYERRVKEDAIKKFKENKISAYVLEDIFSRSLDPNYVLPDDTVEFLEESGTKMINEFCENWGR